MRWFNVIAITEKPDVSEALALVNRYSEAAPTKPEPEDITEEAMKLWDEGPVKAYALGDGEFYAVGLAKCLHDDNPLSENRLSKFYEVVEVPGKQAYEYARTVSPGAPFDLFIRNHFGRNAWAAGGFNGYRCGRDPDSQEFEFIRWEGCDPHSTAPGQRVPAENAIPVRISDIAPKAQRDEYPPFEELVDKFKGAIDGSEPMAFSDWRKYGLALCENPGDAEGAAWSFFCPPAAAVVTPDGVWHDAEKDYEGDEERWNARFFSDIVLPRKDCHLTRFLAESF